MLKLAPEIRPQVARAENGERPDLRVIRSRRKPSSMRVARILVRRSLAALGLGSILMMSGCGGTTSSSVPNIYRGAWAGTWESKTEGESGSISFTVFSDGSLTGTMTRSPALTASLSGNINDLGQMIAVAGFGADGNYQMQGSVVLTNNLLGSFRYNFLGVEYNGSFSCAPASSGG